MILVWFIDEISERVNNRLSKEKERQVIKRANEVLQQYISKYIALFNCVASPIENRKYDASEMIENFTMKDMQNLHEFSLSFTGSLYGSSIKHFLEIELEIRNQINSIIRSVDMNYYTGVLDVLLEYVQISLKYDCRKILLDNDGNEQLKKMVKSTLEKGEGDSFYQDFLLGSVQGFNLMHAYAILYEMMQYERKILLKYKEEITNL